MKQQGNINRQTENLITENNNLKFTQNLQNIPRPAKAMAVSDIAENTGGNTLFLAANETQASAVFEVLNNCKLAKELLYLADWDVSPYDRSSPSPGVLASRAEVLTKLCFSETPKLVITSVTSALQLLPPRQEFESMSSHLYLGKTMEPQELIGKLTEAGFIRNSKAMDLGEFASRGDIVDVVLDNSGYGWRIEFKWDQIESIRKFYTISQISNNNESELSISPTNEVPLNDKTIARFKDNFLTSWGVTHTDNNLYRHITTGIKYQGYEFLKALFFEQLESIFDYISPGTLIADNFCEAELERFWGQIQELYQTRLNSNELAADKRENYYLLPPENIWTEPQNFYRCTNNWPERISFGKATEEPPEFTDYAENKEKLASYDANMGSTSENQEAGVSSKYRSIAGDYRQLNLSFENLGLKSSDLASKLQFFTDNYPGYRLVVATTSNGEMQRLSHLLELSELKVHMHEYFDYEAIINSASNLHLCILPLESSFIKGDILLLKSSELTGKLSSRKSTTNAQFRQKNALESLSNLTEGDLVVHKEHGIGRFKYIETLKTLGKQHDCLLIEYSGGDKLYIPAENFDELKRYGSDEAELDKLGSSSWQNRKEKSKRKVSITAERLIKIAAEREQTHIAHILPNSEIYDKFCQRFPYPETEDQINAIEEIKEDLASDKPMDRLLCGDVGFGKTEVCMRAACITVSNNDDPLEKRGQVIVIAPTTILAKQHYNTFKQRFRGFNLNIKHISRLVSSAEAKKVRQELRDGELDILIGTHALLSKATYPYNLRLLIIDEEQHFGVAQKEKLKSLKAETNVLSLSATPIPRTLQMSLLGIKSLSLLTTPPIDRLAVRTSIIPYDRLMIRDALYKEYFRGGKSFYVTPKISDLEGIYNDLSEILPDLKIALAHGRMPAKEIDNTMNRFYEGEVDILLSTTIIESGIDVSEANTIIINNADKMGLSQLYQLRGRVGRGKVRGYAYLTYDRKQPPTQNAIKRLEVMKDVDSLGAGFKIATNDMDIRGSGNLVGDEQSGHVKEVGVELYQEMLKEEIEKLKQDSSEAGDAKEEEVNPQINLGLSVLIPNDYIDDSNMRLNLYRRISKIDSKEELDNFAAEMIDRFGPLPAEFENLVDTIEIKQLCKQISIAKLESGPKGFVLTFASAGKMKVDSLLAFVGNHPKEAKMKPDNKLVYLTKPATNKLVKQVRNLLEELIELNKANL
jgi:transcription-repair coupling factor (superfamily II helicase)